MVPSFEADDFRVFEEPDVGSLFDAADEVSGHHIGQPRASHEQVDLLCALRKEHGRLTGGICAAHNDDFIAFA